MIMSTTKKSPIRNSNSYMSFQQQQSQQPKKETNHNMRIRPLSPPPPPRPRLILLDRDGVINHDVGAPGVLQPSQLKLTHKAALAIKNLRQHGCKIAIITNQSCVGKGLISENELCIIHDRLLELLVNEEEHDKDETIVIDDNEKEDVLLVDHIFYCTSLRDSGDNRMKPNPGMITEACKLFKVEPNECVMIGDALRDLEAAALAGVEFRILVETGYGLDIMNGIKAPPPASSSLFSGDDGNKEPKMLFVDEEYCRENDQMMGFIQNNSKNDDGKDSSSKVKNKKSSSILPFYYASDLYTASSWILHHTHTC